METPCYVLKAFDPMGNSNRHNTAQDQQARYKSHKKHGECHNQNTRQDEDGARQVSCHIPRFSGHNLSLLCRLHQQVCGVSVDAAQICSETN